MICSRVAGGASTRSRPLQPVALERRLDRDQPARVLGVRAGVVLVRGRVGEVERHRVCGHTVAAAVIARYRPPVTPDPKRPELRRPRRRRRRRRPARRARGGGGGRDGRSWSRASRSPRARASGPRAGSPPRSRPTTRPSATRPTRSPPGAGSAGRARSRSSPGRRPAAVEQLRERGVRFDTDPDGELALGLEGGHSARRIVHAGGSETGRAITGRLAELVAAEPAIEVLEGASARRPVERRRALRRRDHRRGPRSRAPATVLTTGGGAALWRRTTNPRGAIGAGAVLAHAAGAELAGLELCQFHPTALQLPGSRPRRLADHRGRARRGRDPARRRRAALHRRARARATR